MKYRSDRQPNEAVFVQDSTYSRHLLKKRIIKEGLIKYECRMCKNPGEWLGKPLSLQLDHTNGVYNDHRLSNLQFLCANCHTQTDTYGGKNIGVGTWCGRTK